MAWHAAGPFSRSCCGVYTMSDPWDIPPFAMQGEPSYEGINTVKAGALEEFERIEHELSQLCELFNGNRRSEPTHEYGRGSTFKQRREQELERAACRHFKRKPHQYLESEFRKLICRVTKFADRRNDLAHSIIEAVWPASGPPQFFLVPSSYDQKRQPFRYTIKEITYFMFEFGKLQNEIYKFSLVVFPP